MVYCSKCGKQDDTNARQCIICGNEFHEHARIKKSKNYILISVLLILSCVPTAIVSFIYGLKVNSTFVAGEYDQMETASQKARLWMWISVIIGIVITVIIMSYVSKSVLGTLNEMQGLMKME